MYKARHLAGHIIRLLIRGEKVEGGILRGSFGGVMGEEGSVEDTGYEVLRIFKWQDKGVAALAKARTSEDRGNMYVYAHFNIKNHR